MEDINRRALLVRLMPAVVALVAAICLGIPLSHGANETHLDRTKLPQGCSSCHKGHGSKATPMLILSKDELCFKCHGSMKKGTPGEAKTDIYDVMLKRSLIAITAFGLLEKPCRKDLHQPHVM